MVPGHVQVPPFMLAAQYIVTFLPSRLRRRYSPRSFTPMMRNIPVPKPRSQVSNLDVVDLEEEQVPVQRIVKTTRFSK